jgi:TP901 family phage tail tape measure protein
MADIESNIRINIDTSEALGSIKALQAQISAFHVAMRKSNAANAATSAQLQQQLISGINATGKFAASIKTIKTTAESFTTALEKNKLTMGEYFRYAGGASKTFGKLFKSEFETMNKVARERVKDLQTQYIKLGRDANGAMKAIKVRPLVLDMDNLATKTAIAAQKQQLLNQLLKQGSTNLLNFGKNTQWAGRQLMVGFTIPLTMFATTAIKSFNQIEEALVKIKRVYGDMSTTSEDTDKMAKDLQKLAEGYTKYGMAVAETLDMAATAAATGKTGIELLKQVDAAAKLAALGGISQSDALETTISLTNTFSIAAEDLSGKIDFLNAVENQTILNIGDLTTAIPKAAPVIKQLGGNVEDLAFFMTAMREGGINASEGANALKSGMASIINPTGKAVTLLSSFGIGLNEIVDRGKGDIKQTFLDLAAALDTLDPLNRARAIETMFGKFQFSRMSTLLKNIADQNSQAAKVLQLSRETPQELAILSRRELEKTSKSPTYQFKKAMEDFKTSLAPIGVEFIKIFTPIMKGLTDFLKKFNEMGPESKSFIVGLIAAVAGLGPVLLMTFGLMANGFANIIKGFVAMKNFFNSTGKSSKTLGEQTKYMTQEQIEAAAVAASLDQVHGKLTQTFTAERQALQLLIAEYQKAAAAQRTITGGVPITRTGGAPKRYAQGVVSVPGPKGAGDIVPAMLSPGEAVIPSKMASKYAPLISGMVNDSVPGFMSGTVGIGMSGLTERQIEGRLRGLRRLEEISESVAKSELGSMAITSYGKQISKSPGKSFPGWGIGGVYEKADGKRVFVKPMLSVEDAKAELRGTKIAREVHGLETPNQRLVVMRDPSDETGRRRFAALESDFNPSIANIKGTFTKDEMVKQLVASILRGDKDLARGNLGGNILADVGPAGVFDRASGGKEGLARKLALSMPSMEAQAMVNLLGVKGGAKKWFAQTTSDMARKMSPMEYHSLVSREIDTILPKLKKTVGSFKDLTYEEQQAYGNMIKRLEEGKNVDWSKFQSIHASVPGLAKGIVSVPGPKGAGDIFPAMLSPGEAVIPAKMSKKYAPLISGMINDNIPGFEFGIDGFSELSKAEKSKMTQSSKDWTTSYEASHGEYYTAERLKGTLGRLASLDPSLKDMEVSIQRVTKGADGVAEVMRTENVKLSSILPGGENSSWKYGFAGGSTYAGTAALETKSRNQVYNLKTSEGQNISGFPMTLDSVASQGKWAKTIQEEHLSGKKVIANYESKYAKTIQEMIVNGEAASIALADSTKAEKARTSYVRDVSKKILAEGLESQGRVKAGQGLAAAEKILAETDLKVAQARAAGTANAEGLYYASALKHGGTKDFTIYDDPSLMQNARAVTKGSMQRHRPGEAPSSKKGRFLHEGTGTTTRLSSFGGKNAVVLEQQLRKTLIRVEEVANVGIRKIAQKLGINMEKLGTQGGQGLQQGVKRELEIASPSRKMLNLGRQAAQGLFNGVKEKAGAAAQVGRELAQSAVAGMNSARGITPAAPPPITDPFMSQFAPITRDNIGLRGSELDQYNANATGTSVGRQRLARYGGIAGRIGMGAVRGGGRMIGRGIKSGINFAERKYQERMYYQDLNYSARDKLAQHEAMNQQLLAEGKDPLPAPDLSPEEKKAMMRNPTRDEKKAIGAQRKQARRAMGGKLMGAGMAASTVGMMGSMMPGEMGKMMQQAMMPIMAFSMILPLLTSPIGLVVIALGALALAIYTVNAAQDEAQKKALENAEAFEASTKSITKMSEFAGTVTSSEYMDEVRKNQFKMLGFASGKKTFGESFVTTEQGKSLTKNISEKSGKGNAQEAISQMYGQLSGAVMSGAISMAQAKSIAMATAVKAGNVSVGIQVIGKMNKLLGPNGEDLTKNPLKVRMDMVAESQNQLEAGFKNTTGGVQKNYGQRNSTMAQQGGLALGLGALGAGAVAGGAMAAAGLGIGAGGAAVAAGASLGSVIPVFGTIVGAVVGLGVGAYMMWQTAQDAAKKAGELTGATVADAKISFEQNKQMIDSLDVYYGKKIQQLRLQGKVNEANALENKYLKERETLVDAQAKTMKLVIDQVNAAEQQSSEISDAYIKGAEKALDMSYKGDVNQTLFIDANKASLKQLREAGSIDKGIQTTLLLKMASKDISPGQMSSLLAFMSKSKTASDIGVNIATNFTGPTAASAAEVLGLLANTSKIGEAGQLEFMTKISAETTDKGAMSLINAMGQMTTAENIIPANVGVSFYLKNQGALNKYEGMLSKIGPNGVKDISAFYNIIPSVNNSVLTPEEEAMFDNLKNAGEKATFTTMMAMQINIDVNTIVNSDDFKQWLTETGKYGGAQWASSSIPVQVARYRAAQSFQAVEELGSIGTSATPKGGGGSKQDPQASFLDDLVKRIRDVANASQGLTVGFKASYSALRNFAKNGGNIAEGMVTQFYKLGAGTNLISALLGASPEDLAEIFDKNGNIILSKAKEIINDFNSIVEEDSVQSIQLKWMQMTAMDKLQAQTSLYQAGIDVLSGKEKKINKKYDERIKALDEIQRLNGQINQQESNKLDLADALSKGDISAAARAAQKVKTDNISSALEATKNSLEKARQTELESLTIKINGRVWDRIGLETEIDTINGRINQSKLDQLANEIKIGTQLDKNLGKINKINAANNLGGSRGGGGGDSGDKEPPPEKYTEGQDAGNGMKWSKVNGKWKKVDKYKEGESAGTGTGKVWSKKSGKWKQMWDPGAGRTQVDVLANRLSSALGAMKPEEEINAAKNDVINALPGEVRVAFNWLRQAKTLYETDKTKLQDLVRQYNTALGGASSVDNIANYEKQQEAIATKNLLTNQYTLMNNRKTAFMGYRKTLTGYKDQTWWTNKGWFTENQDYYFKNPAAKETQDWGHYAKGGLIKRYFDGGRVFDSRYGLGTDTIPAMLTAGEYVIRKSAVDAIGTGTLDNINRYAKGGLVGDSSATLTDSVYNYNISLNVSSMSDQNDIADAVLGQIKRLDSQRIRGNRV